MMDVQKPELGRPEMSCGGLSSRQKPGKLTIFFGMAPGVGKTYAMLQAAREEAQAGRDVVIGSLQLHDSRQTAALVQKLKQIPGCDAAAELDVEAILSRQAHVAVVDELARANPPGSAHPYRHQDVRELLRAGVDVFTTLNLQDVAGEAEIVQRITGLKIRETVPDSILEGAEIRLIDLPPAKLQQRLRVQMAYLTQDAELSSLSFFSESNLVTLRERAWRFVANRHGHEARAHMRKEQIQGAWKAGPNLLAVVTPGTESEQIVRWTKRQADALNSPWLAVYVETPRPLDEAGHSQITRALALAEELGAEVITTTDHDLVKGILRVAAQRNATQIIMGKASGFDGSFFRRRSIIHRLLRSSNEFQIHLVPVASGSSGKVSRRSTTAGSANLGQYFAAAGVVGAITLLSFFWGEKLGGPYVAALIYLLAVVVLGSFVRRGPALMAAALSAMLCDYFILPPVFTFQLDRPQDALVLIIYFIVALILGQLTTQIRAQQQAERLREERATALYLLTRELNEAATLDQIAERAISHMEHAFKARVRMFTVQPPDQWQQLPRSAGSSVLADKEQQALEWVLKHGERAGKFTSNLPLVETLFAPLTIGGTVVGVVGLQLEQAFPPTLNQLNLLDSFSQQIAFALDRHRLREVSARAKLLAESERLSKTLLNSMSHEMRTPIAVIDSAMNNLVHLNGDTDEEARREIIAAIQDATERLNRLMGNVLDVARLESGHVQPRFTECDVRELVHLAVNNTEAKLGRHKVKIELAENLPLVSMDFVLMEQVLTNLLSNAAFHTPAGTPVNVRARAEREFLVFEVADRGPGIPSEALDRLFEKFYRGPGAPTGGTGLGLSLAKGFVEAQGGRIEAKNRAGGGAIFTVYLPLGNAADASVENAYEQSVE